MCSFSRQILPLLSLVLLLSGCLSKLPQENAAPAAPEMAEPVKSNIADLSPYRLQVGDVMDIKLILNPELNDQVAVRPDGMISTTVVNDVPAYGRTLADLQRDLEKRYKEQLVDPKVSVILRSFAPTRVYVTGEVNAPGEFINVGPTLTLVQAIARAGGMKNSAGTDRILILRHGTGNTTEQFLANYTMAVSGLDPKSDVRLAPYDVVYVPRSDVGNTYLHFQQYIQQFIPVAFGLNYQINSAATQ